MITRSPAGPLRESNRLNSIARLIPSFGSIQQTRLIILKVSAGVAIRTAAFTCAKTKPIKDGMTDPRRQFAGCGRANLPGAPTVTHSAQMERGNVCAQDGGRIERQTLR